MGLRFEISKANTRRLDAITWEWREGHLKTKVVEALEVDVAQPRLDYVSPPKRLGRVAHQSHNERSARIARNAQRADE